VKRGPPAHTQNTTATNLHNQGADNAVSLLAAALPLTFGRRITGTHSWNNTHRGEENGRFMKMVKGGWARGSEGLVRYTECRVFCEGFSVPRFFEKKKVPNFLECFFGF